MQDGVKVHALEGNDARAAALREELVKFSKLYVQGCTADAAKMAATCLEVELEQETAWDALKPFPGVLGVHVETTFGCDHVERRPVC